MDVNRAIKQAERSPDGPMLARPNPFWGLLPAEFAGRLKDYYVYSIVISAAAGVTGTGTSNIQNDSDFVWTDAAIVVTGSDNTTFTAATVVPALVQITDASAGRQLQDSAVAASAWFGSAQLPFKLPMPKIFRAGGQILATVQNQSAGTLVFRLAFHGFKVFPTPAR